MEFGIVGQVSDKQVAYLGRITANVERLERMLNDLPERAKIESGTVEVHLGVVDLSAAIMAVVEVFWKCSRGNRFCSVDQKRLLSSVCERIKISR